MSTFNGKITEIGGIRIDYFKKDDTNDTHIFFLSHFHSGE